MRSHVAIIGVGNPWRRDDGIGWVVAQAAGRRLGPTVDVVESDGEPSRLLDAWADLDLAVLVDAVRSGAAPGTVHVWSGDTGLARAAPPTGTHAFDLTDAIALGSALDRLPARMVVVGVESHDTTAGHGLSSAVGGAVEEAVDVIARLVVDARTPGTFDS